MKRDHPSRNVATIAAHAGEGAPGDLPRAHVQPLYQTSVFDFPSIAASLPALSGNGEPVYGRHGGPNSHAFEDAVAQLEGAEAGLMTASGMGATTAAVLAICSQGDTVVVQRDAYGGTLALFEQDLQRFGITMRAVDAYDATAMGQAVKGAKLVLVESISNPLLKTVDLDEIARASHDAGARLLVDNTFATPLAIRPLEHGADLVIHSATKFIGGHHDLIAGVLVGSTDLIESARGLAIRTGLCAAPFIAWLALRGLRSLDVRMDRAWKNTRELARRLRDDPRVQTVYEAESCALVSFDLGTLEAAERLVSAASLITLSPTLGGITTTLSHPATSSHRDLTEAQRAEVGIGPGLLRMSVGVEHIDDLWGDLSGGN
ncbi:MAG: cystathionine beta-lyase/cystathionine gamma-synthase [Chlamydiales bacterium]|jgi:cystathionine beta-lyase/cystathionine gamma-synthase